MFPVFYRTILAKLFGRYTCLIRISTIVCLLWSSNLLQAGLSVERLASIISPLKTRAMSSGKVTRLVISTIIGFSFVFGITITCLSSKPSTVQYIIDENNVTVIDYDALASCERRNISGGTHIDLTKLVYHLDLILFRAIPFATMLISSAVIVASIKKQRRQRDKLIHTAGSVQNRPLFNPRNRESRASLLLLTMNLTTLLTNPLFLIFELVDGEGSEGRITAKLTGNPCVSWVLRQFFNSLIYFNNQTNWIFYLTFGARFRHYIANMFRCKERKNGVVHTHMSDMPIQLTVETNSRSEQSKLRSRLVSRQYDVNSEVGSRVELDNGRASAELMQLTSPLITTQE
ncbi:unnamed protein product [Calicophoron daubneyi]|uniref:G-protein coupled receptors family 1 profile domain-containing protein n=1 Tax=Calicophoron daubneyi TaxID=300641 RepID=A0AAV2TJT8_CALDB